MIKALKEIVGGFNSLVTGMRITIGQFFKPTITVQYPHESLKMPPRFRGHIELVRDPETGKAMCFACKLCERACPSDCIIVDGAKLEGAKKKSVTKYVLDFTKCSLCGSCVEACRDGAIRFSREFNLAGTNKEDFVMDLFKRLEDEAAHDPVAATPADAPAPAPQSGSPLPQPLSSERRGESEGVMTSGTPASSASAASASAGSASSAASPAPAPGPNPPSSTPTPTPQPASPSAESPKPEAQ